MTRPDKASHLWPHVAAHVRTSKDSCVYSHQPCVSCLCSLVGVAALLPLHICCSVCCPCADMHDMHVIRTTLQQTATPCNNQPHYATVGKLGM